MKCAAGDCPDPVNYTYKDAQAHLRGGPAVEVVRVRSRYCRKHERQKNGQDIPPPRLLLTQQALRALGRR